MQILVSKISSEEPYERRSSFMLKSVIRVIAKSVPSGCSASAEEVLCYYFFCV